MPPSDDSQLRTIADELLELVKKSKKISVEEAAKKLKMPIATVQSFVDFLVEDKIFGIEYKFTTPFIYLYREGVKKTKGKDRGIAKELVTKEQFYENVKKRNVPHEHIEGLWRKYLQQNITNLRKEFVKKAKEKNTPEDQIEDLWKRYLSYL